MFLPFANTRRKTFRGIASRLAMALALAGGAAVGSAAIAPAAYAQENSRGFVAAYEPIGALIQGEMPNWAQASAQFETLVAAIENEDDRNVAGNVALQIGTNTSNPAFQRRGLEMMLASGKVAPEQLGQFNYYVGTLSYQAGDFDAARTALEAAIAAGYTEEDPRGIILQSYFDQDRVPDGITYLESQIAASGTVDENWILRALQESYDAELVPQANQVSALLLKQYPSQKNWVNALQVMNAINQLDAQAQLDLFRLMRTTNALTQRAEYVRYIENADPRIMANEVLPVLAEGLAADHFTTTDDYYTEVKSIADVRAPQDRAEVDSLFSEGQAGDGREALIAGDVLYSVNDYARAEVLYKAAVDKGADRDAALTRLGMVQALQGKGAEAVATLEQVSGARAPVAQMWAIYAQEQTGA